MLFAKQPGAFSLPMTQGTPPIMPQQPADPFVFGAGGARMTPEQIELMQRQALANQQIDASPVGHWTEGLARVANNWVGKIQQGRVDRAIEARASDRDAVLAQLGGNDVNAQRQAVLAALRSDDPALQKYALQLDERLNPKPVNNDTVADYNFRAATLGKDAADEWLRRGNDPFITATTPGGFYAGPQSGFASAMGGGPMPPAAAQPAPSGVPMGSPLDPNLAATGPVSKTINGKTYYQIGGDWYDNPEGR